MLCLKKIELNKNHNSNIAATLSAAERLSHSENESGQSVDKIRDIIFGGQMREYEARFSAVENSGFGRSFLLAL